MASVTVNFSSLDVDELRAVLLAHYQEHRDHTQPAHIATTHAAEHDGNRIGCIVRVCGNAYQVTTMPLRPESAVVVAEAIQS